MPPLNPFTFREKLPAILGRINPITQKVNEQTTAIDQLEADVETLIGDADAPDFTILFENRLI